MRLYCTAVVEFVGVCRTESRECTGTFSFTLPFGPSLLIRRIWTCQFCRICPFHSISPKFFSILPNSLPFCRASFPHPSHLLQTRAAMALITTKCLCQLAAKWYLCNCAKVEWLGCLCCSISTLCVRILCWVSFTGMPSVCIMAWLLPLFICSYILSSFNQKNLCYSGQLCVNNHFFTSWPYNILLLWHCGPWWQWHLFIRQAVAPLKQPPAHILPPCFSNSTIIQHFMYVLVSRYLFSSFVLASLLSSSGDTCLMSVVPRVTILFFTNISEAVPKKASSYHLLLQSQIVVPSCF